MGAAVREKQRCIRCGAALYITEGADHVECRYCHEVMEVTRFTQEERRLAAQVDEMNRSLRDAEQRMEEAMDEFARTGSAAAGALGRQAEAHYEKIQSELARLRGEYENCQAKKLSGWFIQGENAQHLRRYDEAISHYQKVLAVQSDEAEVHWRMLMCRYGVEYVRDQSTGSYLPTLTKMQVDDILQDSDYADACAYAREDSMRAFYEREGKRLDAILRKYQLIGEKPYDVFISVKQGDDEGKMTADSRIGLNLYHTLRGQGLRVFNSAESLSDKAGEEYEPYIMHALSTAKLMVVVASCEDYINSRWLKNEWRRFRWLRESEGVQSERRLIVYSIKQGGQLNVPAEIGAMQMIDAQTDAEPVAHVCRIAREMFKRAVEPQQKTVVRVEEAERTAPKGAQGNADYEQGRAFLCGKGAEIDKQKAFECFLKGADTGHAQSMYELGMRYLLGEGTQKSQKQAAQWLRKSAQKGCAYAQYEYARCCDKGIGTEADMDAAIVWYDKALMQFNKRAESDGMAMYYLGRSLLNGEGAQKDEAQAVTWLRKAAVEDVSDAQFLLGMCYYEGRGVARNDEQAVRNFQKAEARGSMEAQFYLGLCCESGRGTARDEEQAETWFVKAAGQGHEEARRRAEGFADRRRAVQEEAERRRIAEEEERRRREAEEEAERRRREEEAGMSSEEMLSRAAACREAQKEAEAVQWYEKAAARGYAAAQRELGLCYENGRGVARNYGKALEWYRKAAEQEDAEAQFRLGSCYANGRGRFRDISKAIEWYHKAAEQGNTNAQNNLALYYEHGGYIQKDYAKAFEWYCKAAEQGNVFAQYNLGRCFEDGVGTAPDYEQAAKWYQKAAEQGDADALAGQKRIERKKKGGFLSGLFRGTN